MSAILFALSAAACQARRIEYRPPENPMAVTALPIPAQKNHFAVLPRAQTDLSPRPRRQRGSETDGDDDSDSGSGEGGSSAAEFFKSTKGIAIVGGVGGGIVLILVVVLVIVLKLFKVTFKTILKVAINAVIGVALIFLLNFIPGVEIPIVWWSALVSGIFGVVGVVVLLILSFFVF